MSKVVVDDNDGKNILKPEVNPDYRLARKKSLRRFMKDEKGMKAKNPLCKLVESTLYGQPTLVEKQQISIQQERTNRAYEKH